MGLGIVALGSIGLLVLLAIGAAGVWYVITSDRGPSSRDAVTAIDEIVDGVDFDDFGEAPLRRCPFGSTSQLIEGVIGQIDDRRLDVIRRGEPGITHEAYALDLPDSGVQLIGCERLGDDPTIRVVGLNAARAPDDVIGYLSEVTGIDRREFEAELGDDDTRGPVVRWICIDADDVTERFCEVLWVDGTLLLSLYVVGASSPRISDERLREVLLDSIDDWTAALAG